MIALMLMAAAVPTAAGSPAPVPQLPHGTWINPRRSVKVEIRPCADMLCGRVVWASREAIEDAREGGVEPLIGAELLQDYRPTGPLRWQGRVFVPDLNRTFFSRIAADTGGKLTISGCIFGGLICKTQIWTRG